MFHCSKNSREVNNHDNLFIYGEKMADFVKWISENLSFEKIALPNKPITEANFFFG